MDLSDCHSYEDMSAFALRAFALRAFGEFEGQLEENRLEFGKQNIRSRGLFESLLRLPAFPKQRCLGSAPFRIQRPRTSPL